MEKLVSKKDYKPYLCISAFLAAFAVMFALNFIMPIDKTIFVYHFKSLNARALHWSELALCIMSSYYILKTKRFVLLDFIVGAVFGYIAYYAGFNGYISAITTALCYYSACQIFRKYKQENKYFNLDIKKLLKSLLIGTVLAIPFAIVNVLESGNNFKSFNFNNIIPAAIHALPPGTSEEIIWHFFLLAFVTWVFKGKIPENKATTFLIYFLCAVPHTLLHLPETFVNNPMGAIISFLFMCLLFGVPMTWLVKNKNLQTSMAFHWFIDFIRFIF